MQIEHLQHLRARFEPKRLDTLRPEARPFVGQTFKWMASWKITEEDGGPYVGQWAFTLSYSSVNEGQQNFGWVPEEDLVFEEEGTT